MGHVSTTSQGLRAGRSPPIGGKKMGSGSPWLRGAAQGVHGGRAELLQVGDGKGATRGRRCCRSARSHWREGAEEVRGRRHCTKRRKKRAAAHLSQSGGGTIPGEGGGAAEGRRRCNTPGVCTVIK